MAAIGGQHDHPAEHGPHQRRPRVKMYSLLAIVTALAALLSLGASFGMMALNGSAATSIIPIFFLAATFVLLALHWGEVAYANEDRLIQQKSDALQELSEAGLEPETIQRVTAALSKGPQERTFVRAGLDPESLQRLHEAGFDQKFEAKVFEGLPPTRVRRAANGFRKALTPVNKAHTIASNLMALAMAALLIFASILMIRIWLVNRTPPVESSSASGR